jgi:hypothetical protein
MPVEQQKLWDYMPICKLPSEKSDDGNIYKAYGGYRLKKFIDAFKDKGGKDSGVYSICDIDNFKDAMQKIGNAIVKKLRPGCVEYPLIDADPGLDGVQPECRVIDWVSCDSSDPSCLSDGFKKNKIPQCLVNGAPLDPTNPDKKAIDDSARPCWYLVYDGNEDTGCPNAFKHQRISALRPGDGVAPPGTLLQMQCLTCASPPNDKGESTCPAVGTM